MAAPIHDRCPYSLVPLRGLSATNREHIFPDAIGGVLDYVVTVDAKKNADLGTLIDAPLIHSPLISAMRMLHGIRSRSGAPQWKMRGRVKDTDKAVEVSLSTDGPAEVRIRRPVEIDPAGGGGTVIVKKEDSAQFLSDLAAAYAKKGKVIQFGNEVSLGGEVELDLSFDHLLIKRALAKIAYVAIYEYLGDAYLDDPITPEWRKAIFAPSTEEARTAKIHGLAFDAAQSLTMMMPALQPHEHGVAIAHIPGLGIITAVSLFGTGFHHMVAVASGSSTYGLAEAEGRIAICDAKAGKTRFVSFLDHLEQRANVLFPFPPLPPSDRPPIAP